MKFKFRADPEDMLIFLLFAVFLLFIIALGVVNLASLASEGELSGINPFPAFGPDYILATMFFYVVCLIGLLISVSSYFFEREEGFGITLGKKDKGYSRWAKDKEMQAVLYEVDPTAPKSDRAGTPIISKNGKLWVDDGEYHTLVVGATGSGKTQSIIFPAIKVLAKKGESMIMTDPKGELYEKTGGLLKKKGYDIILLNFRNPQKGNAWNPMTLPYRLYKNGNKDKAIELLDDLALNILYEEKSGNSDPFWEKTSADYFSGLALGLFEDAEESQINLNSISLTTTVGEEKCGGSTYVKEYFNLKDPNSPAYINASGTIMAPSDTKGSIISVFKQKIKLFSSRENLSEMLSYSDFQMNTIGERPTAVFIIIQDEKKTYHSLATIFIKQAYETLIDVAQAHGGKLPCRTNFLLDEFANMPPLKDVTTMITAARSRQVRFTMIIQNFAQLNQVYGKENAETIKGNCGNIIYLISTELAALEEISKLCGDQKSKKDDKTASTPLVTVSDLQRMKQFDQIVLRLRMQPFKTSFTPDFAINWGNETSPKIDYPEREKRPVQVFDVRNFVKQKRQEKIKSMMMENDPNSQPAKPTSPFGGGSTSSPFGGNSSSSFGGGSSNSPFGGSSSSSFGADKSASPFADGMTNPFGNFGDKDKSSTPVSPFATPPVNTTSPFDKPAKNVEKKTSQSVDLDELVKKIDAKIAEIEKEEKSTISNEKKEKANELEKSVDTKEVETLNGDNSLKRKEDNIPFISSKSIEDKVNEMLRKQTSSVPEENMPIKKKETEISKPIEKVESDIETSITSNEIKNVDNVGLEKKPLMSTLESERVINTTKVEEIAPELKAPVIETKYEQVPITKQPTIEKKPVVEQPKQVIVEEKIIENTNVISNKPTISLDDVSETEFFDDFFED